ncbi:hypothetical protein [Phenylobacterium aquaticum]|uniref:CASTOR/POLLUX-related putative ion channel n=1 Tax=Phenylobacterium aquaticum TaxID=1763816 RepID=UPI0026F0CBDD|nr:hypothetical protein [Phenylobacterium aquaticum]
MSWSARLRYSFDKSMAGGTVALMGWLALVVLSLASAAGLFLALTHIGPAGSGPLDLRESLWQATMRAINAGPVAGDQGWSYRAVMLPVTLIGIVAFSALIGVLSAGVDAQIERLRKGRSKVLEQDHTIILNWSSSIFDVISELVVANQNQPRPRIVIMADKDKVEMEDEIAAMAPRLGRTRIICRRGAPTDLSDLGIVSPQQSKSVIILSPEGDEPDAQVIKTILALIHDPNRRTEPYRISAEIRDGANGDVARVVGGSEVQLVLADNLLSRIVVQTSRQLGLSAVFSELLDFEGCEFYSHPCPELHGETFGDAIQAFNTSALVGLSSRDGKVQLNPPMDTIITPDQTLVLIAEDDSAIVSSLTRSPQIDRSVIQQPRARPRPVERTLILGWNRRGPNIVTELSRYLSPGSRLVVAAKIPDLAGTLADVPLIGDGVVLETRVIDTCSKASLETLDIAACNSIIVLAHSDQLSAQAADTRTLITLLHLREMADRSGRHINIVSEMADIRNRELAAVTRADDFVVSNKLISLMLAQASENPHILAIFGDLLDEAGSEICLRPVGDYVSLDGPVTFFTIAEAARARGETAFGYCRPRDGAHGATNPGGVVVNPRKSEALDYRSGDRVIVLAVE